MSQPHSKDVKIPFACQDSVILYQNFKYYYRCFGKKNRKISPILMLSGAFQNMNSWKKFADFFSVRTKVVLTDLPGVGKADPVSEEHDMDFFVACIINLIDKLKIKKINIIAASYGTPIAHRFAQLYPERVDRLALTGTMKKIPKEKRKKVANTIKSVINGDMEKFAEEIFNILLCKNKSHTIKKFELAKRIIISGCKSLNEDQKAKYIFNTKRLLTQPPLDLQKKSKVPAIVFTGEYDPFTKPKYCKEIANSFNKAVFVTIKNADHLYHIEQPEIATKLTFDFFVDTPIKKNENISQITYIVNS